MSGAVKKESISIVNASEHNLKNISVQIPLEAFTCVTGVSGCGKSSLVYDTIYAESQRNFLEGMSGNLYGQKLMDKPAVESIENLRPALNVAQRYYNFNPRSTVGTLTDVSHYLRALFALIIGNEEGHPYTENFFSSNNPESCCPKCKGIGEEYVVSERLVVPDPSKTLKKGAILPYKGKETSEEFRLLEAICEEYGIDIDKPFEKLSKKEQDILLYRNTEEIYHLKYKTPKGRYKQKDIHSKGVIVELNEELEHIDIASTFASISKYLTKRECSCCGGTRLKESVLEKRIEGSNIAEAEAMNMADFCKWLSEVNHAYRNSNIHNQVSQLVIQMKNRALKIEELHVGYISMNRSIPTLSGGEIQRIRIANQLNCSLRGLIYILDEPCRGLHIRDIPGIINATEELVKNENTVIAIEHNKQYISHADKIIELGPVGGPKGGYIISEDKEKEHFAYNIKFRESKKTKDYVSLKEINYHNIHGVDAAFPVGAVTCVTGVSGSGKSTFLEVVDSCFNPGAEQLVKKITGTESISKVVRVNQQAIGKTPRSTVISYLEIYETIRSLFAQEPEAVKRGLTASDFSMNVGEGRCECCQGTGYQKITLTYLPDTYVKCPVCNGRRFNDSVLSVKYKGASITDILDASVEDIIHVFDDVPAVYEKLECLIKIGLGYVKLGQMSMNLSGGEAQRIKLAKALGSKSGGHNLYLLDEPTSGLSAEDIEKFCAIIDELRNNGDTLLIIEHNVEFVANNADYVLDFGDRAGEMGGEIVAYGTPEEVFRNEKSSWYQVEKMIAQ